MAAEQDAIRGRSSYPRAETLEVLARNLAAVRERIAVAAERSGRCPEDVRLLPVSKTVPEQRVRLAAQAGCAEFGENKVQEARRKHNNLADLDVGWSSIGHLQTNKTKNVATFATEFQALDRIRVAQALDHRLQVAGRGLDVYDDDGRREGQTGDSSPGSTTGTEPATTSGIEDEQLPEDPQPSDDNPLARPLPEGESLDLGVSSSSNPDDDTDSDCGEEDEQEAGG